MTLSKFDTDVSEASIASIHQQVSKICREEAGEITFLLNVPGLDPLRMRLICRDPSKYPDQSEFMFFAESDDATESIAEPLERLGRWNTWPSIAEAVRLAATEISRHAQGKAAVFGWPGYKTQSQKKAPSSSQRPANAGVSSPASTKYALSTTLHSDIHFKREVLLAQAAGIKTNLIQYTNNEQLHSVLSLSFAASMLGLTKDDLQFREISLRDHVVLLVHLGDIGAAGFNESSILSKHSAVKFRLGRCDEYQPGEDSVKALFGHYETAQAGIRKRTRQNEAFEPVYMSNSINSFLKSDLGRVISLRRMEQMSWAKAHNRFSNQPTTFTPTVEDTGPLRRDYASEVDENFGSSLVAMQYALWRLVNCDKFCMVCHRALGSSVSSIGPFLCEDEFCSFQFISSQLGPDMEQQIRSSPYTVDILVSFFYSAVASSAASDLPSGHGIKLIYLGASTLAPQYYSGTASLRRNIVHLDMERSDTSQPLHEGDLVVIIPRWELAWPDKTIHKWHDGSRHIKRIISLANEWCKYESFDATGRPLQSTQIDVGTPTFSPNEPCEEVYIFGFWHDFSSLELPDQEVALLQTLDCLPTVIQMNSFLWKEPNGKLLTWVRMNYSLVTLLYWIIANNNSGLVQDDSVPNRKNQDERLSASTRISSLHPTYMQFRFVRGSLDCNKAFNAALKRFHPQSQSPSADCTFFACHLTPFEEWSNVLKKGLKSIERMFSIAGGRRHGITFRQGIPMITEHAFAQPVLILNNVFRQRFWVKSVLHPIKAAAICEIVHCGEEPQLPRYIRYAIDNPGLAELRYLVVKVDPTTEAMQLPLGAKWASADDRAGFAAQMPERHLIQDNCSGSIIRLNIPMASLPDAWYRKSTLSGTRQHSEAESDLESFTEPEFELETATKRRKRTCAVNSMIYNKAKRYKVGAAGDSSDGTSEGEGVINCSPTIPPPIWTSSPSYSLHRLQQEERDLRQIQKEMLIDERGWAIHFEELPNLFQWVVEFPYILRDEAIFLQLHFGPTYPFCPPFVRILKPCLRSKHNVVHTICLETGCICMKLLTMSGWNPTLPMSSVLNTLRLYLEETIGNATRRKGQYRMQGAVQNFPRLVKDNRWETPDDFYLIAAETMR